MTLLRAGLLQQDALRKTEDSKLALYPTEAQAAASAAHVAGAAARQRGAASCVGRACRVSPPLTTRPPLEAQASSRAPTGRSPRQSAASARAGRRRANSCARYLNPCWHGPSAIVRARLQSRVARGRGGIAGPWPIDNHARMLARAQCRCRGSCQFVHVACLQRWLQCRPASAGSQDYNAVTVRRDISEAVAPQCEVCVCVCVCGGWGRPPGGG